MLAADGPLSAPRAVSVVSQVAAALDAAHAEALVHRDVKPSNVLLTGPAGREFVYLVDFGIARAVGNADATSMTVTGATVGTLDYMAPERFLGAEADHRVDVYSLACLLYEALTAHKPFRAGTDLPAMLHAHLNTDPPAPSRERPSLPVALDTVIATGMAKQPQHRYPTAGDLADAAHTALTTTPATTTPATTTPPTSPSHQPPPTPEPPPPTPPAAWPQPQTPPAAWPPPHTPPGSWGPPPTLPLPQTIAQSPPWSGAPAGPAPPAPRRRWPIIAAAAAIVVVLAVGVAVAVPLIGRIGQGTTTGSAPPSSPPPSAPVQYPRPASLPNGDPTADQPLWDALAKESTGNDWSACAYLAPTGTERSYLECPTAAPSLGYQAGYAIYPTAAEAYQDVTSYSTQATGSPGPCGVGVFTGKLLGREVACGFRQRSDGTTGYLIVWTKVESPVYGQVEDTDPAKAFQWFVAHDPF